MTSLIEVQEGVSEARTFGQSFPFVITIFVSSHKYPENPEGTQIIVGSIEHGIYIRHCQESNSQPVSVLSFLFVWNVWPRVWTTTYI